MIDPKFGQIKSMLHPLMPPLVDRYNHVTRISFLTTSYLGCPSSSLHLVFYSHSKNPQDPNLSPPPIDSSNDTTTLLTP